GWRGADQSRVGWWEAGDRGTLFLDEMGEMAASLESKLLRFLQEHTLQRVGSSKPRRVDVRVLAATNRDLLEAVQSGRFREDLYYRLNVVPITVPPLRQHREDVALLAGRFLQRFALKYRKLVRGFAEDSLEIPTAYDWPGHVREVENLVERLVILSTAEVIGRESLPREVQTSERTLTFPTLVAEPAPEPETGLRPI